MRRELSVLASPLAPEHVAGTGRQRCPGVFGLLLSDCTGPVTAQLKLSSECGVRARTERGQSPVSEISRFQNTVLGLRRERLGWNLCPS